MCLYQRSTLSQKLQNNYILLSSCMFTQILLLDITEDEMATNPLQISSTFLGTFLIIVSYTYMFTLDVKVISLIIELQVSLNA